MSLFGRTSHCYGLVCSYPGWLLASLAFLSGCSFGSVGMQTSVFPVDPLFYSTALVFLAQLPVISLYPTLSAWTHFSPSFLPLTPVPSNWPLLLPCFFQFSFFFSIVGNVLSLLDLCNTLKIKSAVGFEAVSAINIPYGNDLPIQRALCLNIILEGYFCILKLIW